MTLKIVLVILHIITAAAWFGLALRPAGQARRALRMEPGAGRALIEEARGSVRLMGIFLVLTLLLGLVAFFVGGGFEVYGPTYHTSILLLVILLLVHFFIIRSAFDGLAEAFAGGAAPVEAADRYRSRAAMGIGIGHLLWLVTLVLMFGPRLGL